MNTWNHTIYFAQLLTQLLTCFFLSTTKKRGHLGHPFPPKGLRLQLFLRHSGRRYQGRSTHGGEDFRGHGTGRTQTPTLSEEGAQARPRRRQKYPKKKNSTCVKVFRKKNGKASYTQGGYEDYGVNPC